MTMHLAKLIVMSCVFVVTLGVYSWWYSVVAAESDRAAELAVKIEEKTTTKNRAAAVRATLGQLASDESRIGRYFVPLDTIASFLNTLEAQGTAAGATAKVSSVLPVSVGGNSMLQVVVSISGTFAAVMNTVGRIEYAPYDLTVNAFSMGLSSGISEEKDTSAKKWTANLTISAGTATTTASAAPASSPHATTTVPRPI